ncbi:vasotab-like [Homalodisca vitripennis]|uniref:vasotab-like n=1 Tax=Homalodisca vitripennis TaxID=197043 RepID=UPI001EEB94B1|nr:vasotab-like [Homalodisca vitripennis]
MRLLAVLLFALCVALVWAQQPCPGKCGGEWMPVCGLNSKKLLRTFRNVCELSDWNRCNKGDYQVSKFSTC